MENCHFPGRRGNPSLEVDQMASIIGFTIQAPYIHPIGEGEPFKWYSQSMHMGLYSIPAFHTVSSMTEN